jgi:hypothetical protein
MLHNLLHGTMAVPLWILEQFTKLVVGQPFPDHRRRGRREAPVGRSGGHVQTHKVVVLMAGAALDRIYALPLLATVNPHCVAMAVVALTRKIPSGVTIHTTGVA